MLFDDGQFRLYVARGIARLGQLSALSSGQADPHKERREYSIEHEPEAGGL
jgi:hypothetical protein